MCEAVDHRVGRTTWPESAWGQSDVGGSRHRLSAQSSQMWQKQHIVSSERHLLSTHGNVMRKMGMLNSLGVENENLHAIREEYALGKGPRVGSVDSRRHAGTARP
jgi:hypothetical protein